MGHRLDYYVFFLTSDAAPLSLSHTLSLFPFFFFLQKKKKTPRPPKLKSQEVLKTQGIALFSYPKANTSE